MLWGGGGGGGGETPPNNPLTIHQVIRLRKMQKSMILVKTMIW